MPFCQKYRIKYSIQTNLQPLISIPETETESESDEPFESYIRYFPKNLENFADFSQKIDYFLNGSPDFEFLFGFEFSVPILVGFKCWAVKFVQDGLKLSFLFN